MMNVFLMMIFLNLSLYANVSVFGRVFDNKSEKPIANAEVFSGAGKLLVETSENGTFELQAPSLKAKIFIKAVGYSTDTVSLGEVADLYNLEIYLKSSVQKLETSVKSTKKNFGKKRTLYKFSPRELELFQGLQNDLNDQLRLIPGVNGTKEFSSELSINGSAPGEVLAHVGPIELPFAQHLDIGLPGNLSLLAPAIFSKIEPVYTLSERVMGGGGGGALIFTAKDVDVKSLGGRVNLGTALREVELESPFVMGDGVRVSGRFLDEGLIENMGNKYFADFRKRGNEDSCDDNCDKARFGNEYNLNAWDLFVQNGYRDSTGSFHWFYLKAYDDYQILLDTAHSYSVIENEKIEIFSGEQDLSVVGAEYITKSGWSMHASFMSYELGNTQRDTLLVSSSEESSKYHSNDPMLLGKSVQSQTRWQLGFDGNLGKVLGSTMSLGVRAEGLEEALKEKLPGAQVEMNNEAIQLGALSRMQWGRKAPIQLSMGAKFDADNTTIGPQLSLEYKSEKSELGRIYIDGAWRSQRQTYVSDYQKTTAEYFQNYSSRLGWQKQQGAFKFDAHGYGRFYPKAQLPRPDVFTSYSLDVATSEAWVSGLALHLQWNTFHSWAVQSQVSSLYGEFGTGQAWTGNRSLDAITNVRWYPRNDSLVSLILIHRASIGAPTQRYKVAQHSKDEKGVLSSVYSEETLDVFRTDIRMHLNLPSKLPPLKDVRLYVEVNNLFEAFDLESLSFLGSDNGRQRGWTQEERQREGELELVPYLAPGMGFFLQFGVEAKFGF